MQTLRCYSGEKGDVMGNKVFIRLSLPIAALFLLSDIYGCVRVGAEFDLPFPSVVAVKESGPPSHAKAYGRRSNHTYRYYPSAGIYFDIDSRSYFYLEGTAWRMSVSLPRELKINLGSHVTLEMDTARPYLKHREHKKKYPPGQLKKKKKGNGKNKNKWK